MAADKHTSLAMPSSTTFGYPLPTNASTSSHSPPSNNNQNYTMASSNAPSMSAEFKKPLDISNLMSPPELAPLESFAIHDMSKPMRAGISDMRKAPGPNPPLSPPISPFAKIDDNASPPATTSVKDPILYQDIPSTSAQQPLFARDDSADAQRVDKGKSVETQRIVDGHLVARPAYLFKKAKPPPREHYELALAFKSKMMDIYMVDPVGWLQREREQLYADRKASARRYQVKPRQILPATTQPIRTQVQRITKASRSPKQRQAPASRPIRSNPPAPAPRQQVARRASATPDPASRRGAAPNREDKDFASLEDLCPPLSSLPAKSNSLKVDWKGAPIDLGNDPHRHLLHPDEITLAANLRLDCATYLTSKRRMFIQRRYCLHINKEFRKTDAQQACKIDVNKASKLWTAFEKVGWLDKRWVAEFPYKG